MLAEDFEGNTPDIVMAFYGFEPTLWIQSTEVLNDLYVARNRYFDKHDLLKNVVSPLLGEGLLLERSDELWGKKRK